MPWRSAATVGEWIDKIEPTPPPALHQRLRDLLASSASRPASDVPEACLEAGEQLLDALLTGGSTSRETALDLLAADSLVTYAFQAAAYDPARMEERTARAMSRIAAIPGTMQG